MSGENCRHAVQALLDGRWLDWHGLTEDCALADLQDMLGGSTVLDMRDVLGRDGTDCSRSSMRGEPLIVWHVEQQVLLIESDRLSAPLPVGDLRGEAVHRLDTSWGFARLEQGEWVLPARGLSLIVTSNGNVVCARGFAPTSLDHYVAHLRPRSQISVLHPSAPARLPRHGEGA